MDQICTRCRHSNPQWGKFCGRCGASLTADAAATAPAPPPGPARERPSAAPRPARSRRLGWLAVVGLMGLGWFWVMKPRSPMSAAGWAPFKEETSQQNVFIYDRHEDLADALYDLLRNGAPIQVRRTADGDGIVVTGHAPQVQAVRNLAQAVEARSRSDRSSMTLRGYALERSQRRAIEEVLEQAGSRVHMEARDGLLWLRAPDPIHHAVAELLPMLNGGTMRDVSRPPG